MFLLPVLAAVLLAAAPHSIDPDPAVPVWEIDRSHSAIGFKVRHLGISTVRGRFDEIDATFQLDPSDLTTFRASATINAASINTNNERRDNHLRSDDFFDAANHPAITFESREIRNVEGSRFEIVGDLTMRGVTREVVFDAEVLGQAQSGDTQRLALEAAATIDRFEYGLHWDRVTEAGGLVVGREVEIVLEIQGVRR